MKDWTTLEGFFETNNQKEYSRLLEMIPDSSLFVEVGCFKGKSMCSIAPIVLRKKLTVIAVDIFGTVHYNEPGVNRSESGMINEFVANVKDAGLDPLIICGTSVNASEFLKKCNLRPSMVFLDADHTFEGLKLDIECWWPLLLPGGIMAGHDYDPAGIGWPGVYKAVNETFPGKYHADMFIWSTIKP